MHISVREMAEKFRRDMGRPYYTTPTSYLELIGTYKRILHEKRDVVTRQQTRSRA
jgi:dynein heavy chain